MTIAALINTGGRLKSTRKTFVITLNVPEEDGRLLTALYVRDSVYHTLKRSMAEKFELLAWTERTFDWPAAGLH